MASQLQCCLTEARSERRIRCATTIGEAPALNSPRQQLIPSPVSWPLRLIWSGCPGSSFVSTPDCLNIEITALACSISFRAATTISVLSPSHRRCQRKRDVFPDRAVGMEDGGCWLAARAADKLVAADGERFLLKMLPSGRKTGPRGRISFEDGGKTGFRGGKR